MIYPGDYMNREEQKAIYKEFSNIFTSLSARVDVFKATQSNFIDLNFDKIKQVLGELPKQDLDLVVAIYGICIMDDVIKSYTIKEFAEDIKYLYSISKEIEKIKQSKIPLEEQIELYEKNTVQIKEENEKTEEFETLSDRILKSKNDTLFMRILTAYYQSNSIIEKSINNLNSDLIIFKANNKPELIITSLLIRKHLLPMFDKMVSIYSSAEINIDLRFITAQIIISFERIISPNKKTPSIAHIYEDLKKEYPLGSGSDLYWDLSEQLIYNRYYPKLCELLSEQIKNAANEIKMRNETMKNKLEQLKKQMPGVPTTESIRSKVDSLIFETLNFNRNFDDNARSKFQKAVESVLKRMTMEEFGVQDIPQYDKFIDYFNREFFTPIFDEYPAFYLQFIDIRDYRSFVHNPKKLIEEQKEFILNQFWFRMRRHMRTSNPNSSQLAYAFSMVMYDILNDDRIRNFDM